jgi:hypothetical protein
MLLQVHIVSFDADQRISSVRLYWDQGSLLKQVDVIGSRGRSWPIRDGKEQARLITPITGSPESSAAPSRRSTQSMAADEVVTSARSHASSLTSQRGEPRTFSLFQSAVPSEDEPTGPNGGPVISPRASAKPPARGLEDILTGTEEEPVQVSEFRPPSSPRKQVNGGAPKAGAGTHFHPIRLFDENDAPPSFKSPEKLKTDPRKYKHFEFGSGEDAQSGPSHTTKSKHTSQWDFADFVTPEKPRTMAKIRTQDTRNFGWSDDEVWALNFPSISRDISTYPSKQEKSPVHRQIVHHPRPDAETHFEFVDDGTPMTQKTRPTSKGRQHNDGLGLYRENVLDPEGAADEKKEGAATKKPLATIVNVNVDSRHRDFDSQFEMTDQSPSVSRVATNDENGGASGVKKLDENKAKVLKTMSASWQLCDDSSDAVDAKKENIPASGGGKTDKGIKTTGNGMGGRRDNERHWGFGDEDEDVKEETTKKTASGGQSQGTEVKSFWDF